MSVSHERSKGCSPPTIFLQGSRRTVFGRESFLFNLLIVFSCYAIAVLSFSCLLEGCSRTSSGDTPVSTPNGLYCEKPVWNLGVIDATECKTFSREFKLENHSSNPIAIEHVRSSCGCMVAEGYEKKILPGGNTVIKVTINIAPIPGALQKQLLVETDTLNDKIVLRVAGFQKLNASLYTFPGKVDFGEMASGETKTRKLRVGRYDGSPVKFEEVQFSDKHIRLSSDIIDEDDNQISFDMLFDAVDLDIGDHKSTMVLHCSHSRFKKLTIPICVTIIASSSKN